METNKNKKVLNIVLDDDVRKLTIEGRNGDQEVVMREELSDDELDAVVGGVTFNPANCSSFDMEAIRNKVETEPMKSWWFF